MKLISQSAEVCEDINQGSFFKAGYEVDYSATRVGPSPDREIR